MERKIVTSHVYPPIPIRQWDWCAFLDGQEEDGPYGWGRTEEEAIAELEQYLDDESERWRVENGQFGVGA